MLDPVRWLARLVSAVFFIAGFALANSQIARGPYHGASLILVGASTFPLADVVARLAVGPAGVPSNAAQVHKMWRGTTMMGLTLISGGVMLHVIWHQLP